MNTRLYYLLKPYVPWRFRILMRRVVAQRKRRRFQQVWPIDQSSTTPPSGWPGWKDGKRFAFVLTHDVEGPAGLAKCRRLAELELSLGFRSAFNFVPEGTYRVPPEFRDWLSSRGFEVGVHDLHHDGSLYRSQRDFDEQAGRINHYLKDWGAVGFRAGFMFHNLEWIKQLNVQYDASTFDTDPFEPQPDGAGTIFPFWVDRNPATDSSSVFPDAVSHQGYVELPYTLPQDSTLFLLFRESSPAMWLQKLDWIIAHGGMALVNVHPDYVQFQGDAKAPNTFPADFYAEVLRRVRDQHNSSCWHALPREIASYVAPYRPIKTTGPNLVHAK